jgi:hypothetical protein
VYNPYVTVDYLEGVPTNHADDAPWVDPDDPTPQPAKTPVEERTSAARRQPYKAAPLSTYRLEVLRAGRKDSRPLPQPNAQQPQHTFFRQNAREADNPQQNTPHQTMDMPFEWLLHLDRRLVSPMELLHVSAYKPHLLTQQFFPGPAHAHRANWFDQSTRLYRFFEFVKTGEFASGVANDVRRRIPGKVNLNNSWDEEVLQSLLAPPDPTNLNNERDNNYTKDEVTTAFRSLLASRTPTKATVSGVDIHYPGQNDRPFWPLSAPIIDPPDPNLPPDPNRQYLRGAGILDTILRPRNPMQPLGQRIFEGSAAAHPSQQMEMLTKLYNNVTTRSNVFAVWVTVGFFEVDETTGKLKAELGRAEGRNVRHRLFAIVDRSMLQFNPGPQASFNPRQAVSPGTEDDTTPAITGGRVVPYFNIIE